MRFKIFSTNKPKRFSFHTRYYDENKLSRDDQSTVEKGSFAKHRGRYEKSLFEKENEKADRNRRYLLMSIFFGLFTVALVGFGFYKYGVLPGVIFLMLVLALLKKASK